MNELFLFVRPPRPLWPFNGPSSAFWPPLAFASMAAALREELADLRVEILDAPALEMGWRSLERELGRRAPAYVGIGEEAVSCVEGLRLARLAKGVGATVVAGGCFFGHVADEVLQTGLIDVVAHGEGERTVVELVQALRDVSPNPLASVDGISYLRDGEVITTKPRALIPNLDRLPFPAYDLLPVERYGARSRNHPHLAAIELSRGCFGRCSFCVLWRQMGRFVDGEYSPIVRAKSPERLLEEIRILVRRFGRRYLGWVDPCFNAHPYAPGALADRLLREGIQVGQAAWMRTDALVRDADSGVLASCVDSGLNEVYLGIERPDARGLEALGKTAGAEEARRALGVLRECYPEVLAVGSFIYGLPGDCAASVRAIHRLAIDLGLDQFFFIPLTPLPGTEGWRKEFWDASGEAFRDFDFLPSGRPHGRHASLERALMRSMLLYWPPARIGAYARRLLSRDARKCRVSWRLIGRGAAFQCRQLAKLLLGSSRDGNLVYPRWYNG